MNEETPNRPIGSDEKPQDSGESGFGTGSIVELLESCAPHQRALLGVLAVAQIHNMDPAALISSLASELSGSTRLKFESLAEQMSAGVEFVDAVEEIPDLLPPSVILAFQLARDNGALLKLNKSIADLDANRELDASIDEETCVSRYAGLMLRVFIFFSVISFTALKIFPEFLKMLEEFGVEAPVSLRMLIEVLDLCAKSLVSFSLVSVRGHSFLFAGDSSLFTTMESHYMAAANGFAACGASPFAGFNRRSWQVNPIRDRDDCRQPENTRSTGSI